MIDVPRVPVLLPALVLLFAVLTVLGACSLPSAPSTADTAGGSGSSRAPSSRTPSAGSSAPAGTPYARTEFGDGWRSVNRWCDTRDAVLARDLHATDTSHGCDVLAGTFTDPYTGTVYAGPSRALDIDHVVPLSLAWRLGAWRWSAAQRQDFANDLGNLQTTLARINRSKGDDGLDQWVPPHDPCGYAHRFDTVADHYGLADPARDGEVVTVCRTGRPATVAGG